MVRSPDIVLLSKHVSTESMCVVPSFDQGVTIKVTHLSHQHYLPYFQNQPVNVSYCLLSASSPATILDAKTESIHNHLMVSRRLLPFFEKTTTPFYVLVTEKKTMSIV